MSKWFKGKGKTSRSKNTSTAPVSQSNATTASTSSGWEKTRDTAIPILEFVSNIAEASDILSSLKAACKATKQILEMTRTMQNNKEDWERLTKRLQGHLESMNDLIAKLEADPERNRKTNESLQQLLRDYAKKLDEIQKALTDEERARSRLWSRARKMDMDAGNIREFHQDIDDCHQKLMTALAISSAVDIQTIKGDTKTLMKDVDAIAMTLLPVSLSISSSTVHNGCNPKTRVAVLNSIRIWGEGEFNEPIFWLCDIAGSGKSTVSTSMVKFWNEKGLLGGHFFFSAATSDESTIANMCPSIAKQMFDNLQMLRPFVVDAVKRHTSIMTSPFEEQFRKLIVEPINHQNIPVILVIDALDECKSVTERRRLVETLSMAVRESANLKIFMTSRPDPVIQAVLGSLPFKAKLEDRLHDASHPDNTNDIAIYIDEVINGMLADDKKRHLVENSNGLFIWASIACRMLKSETTLETPEVIYDRLVSLDQPGDLDHIYDLIFERIDPNSFTIMFKMLGILLAAFEPLSTDDLEDLLKHVGIRGNVNALIQNLGSVLSVDRNTNLIRFRHHTLVKYLRRRSRASAAHGHDKAHIDMVEAHGQVASWCLKRLVSSTEGVKFNICQIDSSFYLNRHIPDIDTRISTFIPRRLHYASLHWLFHLAETDDTWRGRLKGKLQHILQIPLVLHWMEIVSLTRGVPRAIAGLRAVTRHPRLEGKTRVRMTDIRRFMMAFSVPIQESVAHIYISALPFAPKRSILHAEGEGWFANNLAVIQGLEEEYPGLPRTLRGHQGSIMAISISPDGSRIVSSSADKAIRLWEADTGQPLGEPLQGHEGWVSAIGFSPDGSQIVSGSWDKTIRLWDADTGQSLGVPLRSHEGEVWAVGFSPDGLRIVSSSEDTTIRLWEVDAGQPIGDPLRGHKDSVWAVVFSPDGSRIVSSSEDKTIRLWDATIGQPLGQLPHGHKSPVRTVAFSPDGSNLVFGFGDKTIQLWDVDADRPLGKPLLGHRGSVLAVAFSPDGSRIISGSEDGTTRMWEVETGQPFGEPLRGHGGWVNTVAFSPDGSWIISGSSDETIRMWEADTGQPLGEPLRSHEDEVLDVAFSPDGSRIASSSHDKSVRLWEASTGRPLGEPLRGHESSVLTIAFSPDGSRVASGSDDNMIRMWKVDTGEPIDEPLRGHTGSVNAVAFSPDGSRVVSGSSDNTIRLWDVATGRTLGEPLRGHEHEVLTVALSPDGTRIISGSKDKTIRMWKVDSGEPIDEPLRGHAASVNAIAFSPDGSRIVSGSDDMTIRLWEAETGQLLGNPLRVDGFPVLTVAFSPGGSRIVSGSDDKMVRIWDVDTGQLLGEPFRGHQSWVNAVAFSPSGSHVVSCSRDRTIRLWKADAGQSLGEPRRVAQSSTLAVVVSPNSAASVRDIETAAGAHNAKQEAGEPPGLILKGEVQHTPLGIIVPGFKQCSLSEDGWVQSSDKHLFWVPPENRHGLIYLNHLTIPITSSFRATKLDFTQFQCGSSWTNVRTDSN